MPKNHQKDSESKKKHDQNKSKWVKVFVRDNLKDDANWKRIPAAEELKTFVNAAGARDWIQANGDHSKAYIIKSFDNYTFPIGFHPEKWVWNEATQWHKSHYTQTLHNNKVVDRKIGIITDD